MAGTTGRFSQLQWLQNAICVLGIVGAVVLTGLGLTGYGDTTRIWMVAAGGFCLFVSTMLLTITPLVLKMESTLARQLSELRDLSELLAAQKTHLAAISENTFISDTAKSLAHREQELDSLRAAIRDDLKVEKWDAALSLTDEMERRFGCKEEADGVREEVDQAKDDAIQVRLNEAITIIESHFESHNWERAQGEIDRLLNALPDDVKVISLQDRMRTMQDNHKIELKAEWNEAVRRCDTDHAIDILKELDPYLSPAEARELQDSARDVFKEKLLQLGVQFRFAVTEKRWNDALTSGLEIVRDFPNARMANEVREALDTLRERARAAAEAEGVPTPNLST